MSQFLSDTAFGLVSAAVIAMASVGFTLQFSVTNVLNISFGAMMTLAAFIGYEFNGVLGVNMVATVIATALVMGVASVLMNRGILQPFLRKGTTFFGMVVVTIALDLIIEYLVEAIWGTGFRHYLVGAGKPVHLGSLVFTHVQLVAVFVALGSMVAVFLLLQYTKLGKAMRATSCDERLARVCGIRTSMVYDLGWFISGMLAGLAGVMLGLTLGTFDFTVGDQYLVMIIAATMLGGIGQAYGAMLGALVIGLVTQWSVQFLPSAYSEVVAFVILIVVLLVRPSGILPGIALERQVAA